MWFLVFFLFTSNAIGQTDYIPPKAFFYRDTIQSEISTYFKDIPTYNYVPGLIEHESCISLKHKRCWEPTSQLKTKREEGAGLSQITRTFREDGSIRFDSLTEMRNRYKNELKEAKWETIYQRPDVQIRILILMSRDNFKKLYDVKDPNNRLAMTDAAYNAGLGAVNRKRRNCGLKANCNPQLWFNNVETECTGMNKAIYGNRTACSISNHHVDDVINVKIPKYKMMYFKGQ